MNSYYNLFLFIFLISPLAMAQSNANNPAISLNGLFLGQSSIQSEIEDSPQALSVQELELRLTSNIDPYFRGEFVLAIHPEEEEDGAADEVEVEHGHESGYHFEPEEAFIETLQIPSVTFRIGKFYSFFGRHNQLHTHAFPFIDAPLPHQQILGYEGFNEVGVSLAYLLPAAWYSEIYLQAFSVHNALFDSGKSAVITPVVYFKNLWDLSDATTLEVGLGAASGENEESSSSELYNGTLSVKWRPTTLGRYAALAWTTEYLCASPGLETSTESSGLSSWIEYQLNRNWWIQTRAENYNSKSSTEDLTAEKYSALIGYIPSEYSALRLQYDHLHNDEGTDQTLTLQLNMSLGAHPAHNY